MLRAFNQETTLQTKETDKTFKVPKSDWKPKLKPVRRRHNDYLTRRNRFDNASINQLLNCIGSIVTVYIGHIV